MTKILNTLYEPFSNVIYGFPGSIRPSQTLFIPPTFLVPPNFPNIYSKGGLLKLNFRIPHYVPKDKIWRQVNMQNGKEGLIRDRVRLIRVALLPHFPFLEKKVLRVSEKS